MASERIVGGEYREVTYLQFAPAGAFIAVRAVLGVLSWPIVWPLAMVCRRSEILFRSVSEFLSFVPYFPGVIVRYEFYRFALKNCGKNVVIEYGTIFIYPDVSIGDNVLIGRYNIVHHCDFGDYVITGERCTFLSGSRQHNFQRVDVPIAMQGGQKRRIRIAGDCWIGAHAVVMDDVGRGAIVGAGAVVVHPVETNAIVVGNPARSLRRRDQNA